MDAIKVIGQPPRRLRVPGRENPRRLQAAEDVDAAGRANRLGRLREDVIRQIVVRDGTGVRDVERAVTFRVPYLEGFDADALRRHADPGVARADEMLVALEPVDV